MRKQMYVCLCMPMASRLEVRVEVRDCATFVEVVVGKVDDRNAERIMRTEIMDRFVIKSLPTDDLLGQFTEEKEDGEIQKFSYWTFTVLLGVLWGYF